jgi:hypothetical protein
MPTLTGSSTFAIGATVVTHEEVSITALPAVSEGDGMGSLVHPTLGTLEYDHPPTEWVNVDSDVIVAPAWSSVKTLLGSANTLWAGNIRDVVCVERWRGRGGDLRMKIGQLRTLIAFFVAPPDPSTAAVLWYPSYCSALGFEVALVGLTVGGEGVALDWVSQQDPGFVADRDVELTLKVLGREP